MSDKATIKIPRNLYNKLNTIIEDKGFNSVTEFIVYVMRDLVSTAAIAEDESGDIGDIDQDQLSGDEIKLIRKRLQSLGYLD